MVDSEKDSAVGKAAQQRLARLEMASTRSWYNWFSRQKPVPRKMEGEGLGGLGAGLPGGDLGTLPEAPGSDFMKDVPADNTEEAAKPEAGKEDAMPLRLGSGLPEDATTPPKPEAPPPVRMRRERTPADRRRRKPMLHRSTRRRRTLRQIDAPQIGRSARASGGPGEERRRWPVAPGFRCHVGPSWGCVQVLCSVLPASVRQWRFHGRPAPRAFLPCCHKIRIEVLMSSVEPLELVVGDEDAGARLDVFLAHKCTAHSRVQLRRAISVGGVLVDGRRTKAAYRLAGGQRVLVVLPDLPRTVPAAEAIELSILYEDEALVVINKPPRMVVHPSKGRTS